MPIRVQQNNNRGSQQAGPSNARTIPLRGGRLDVSEPSLSDDLREYKIVPRPLRDPQGQLIQNPKVVGRVNRAMVDAIARYQGEGEARPFYEMICPISWDTIVNPVQFADGFTYDRESAQGWKDSHNGTGGTVLSPMTNLPLPPPVTLHTDPMILRLALYGHLAREGSWEGAPSDLDLQPLPVVPAKPRIRRAVLGGGLITAVSTAGALIATALTTLHDLGTLEVPACTPGMCGNVAAQSFGYNNATVPDNVTGQNQTWTLLNTVNITGQGAIDACRAAALACYESYVPAVQAFEHNADNKVATGTALTILGGVMAPVIMVGAVGLGYACVRHATRNERQARNAALQARGGFESLYHEVEDMLRSDLEELRKTKARAPARPAPAPAAEVEMTNLENNATV